MPFTACMAKGKAHQIDELGNQVGLIATGGPTMIITAIRAFEGNPHDRQTIQPLWEPQESIVGLAPKEWVVDRGGAWKTSDGKHQEIDSRQTTEKPYPVSKAQEAEKVPTPNGHGATDGPSQNRTSSAGK